MNEMRGVVMDDETGTTMGTEMVPAMGDEVDTAVNGDVVLMGDELVPAALADKIVQGVADQVNGCLAKSVEAIVEAGFALIHAQDTLGHGQWGRLFRSHPRAVQSPLRISQGTAQRYMKIAWHPVLANPAHGPFLPPSWRTLYELSKLKAPVLEQAIAEGRVHPEMEREDATALIHPRREEPAARVPGEPEQVEITIEPAALETVAELARQGAELVAAVVVAGERVSVEVSRRALVVFDVLRQLAPLLDATPVPVVLAGLAPHQRDVFVQRARGTAAWLDEAVGLLTTRPPETEAKP